MEFKDYELRDQVSIGPYAFEVRDSVCGAYFLLGLHCNGHEIFKYLGVEKSSYVKKVVGHELGGGFPEVQTLEDLNKVIKQLQIDCLLKEAREKYPVGVVFRSIFNKFDYTSSGKFKWIPEDVALRDVEVYGVIWHWNEWAEIITKEPKQPEINTYGLKVGDEFSNRVLSEWAAHGRNRQQKKEMNGEWYNHKSNFGSNRSIESFRNIDGVVGFLVSGTNEVYLRAEGFKEFAESFDKLKFEVGKWYRCKGYSYTIKYLRAEARNSKYVIVYSDIIYGNKNYESYPEGTKGVGYIDGAGWYELTDLSEIQEFLPEGHSDKIIKKKYTLEELINEKIIVYIDSQEEFDKITKAGKKIKGFISTSKYWGKYCYNFKNGDYSSNSSKTDIGGYEPGCIIITIDDILIPEESINYVGRYIKILEDNPVEANVKKGEIFQVKRQEDCNIFYSENEWTINYTYNLGTLFELMPEDYSPERINPNTDFIFEPNAYYVGEWEQGVKKRVIFKTTTNKLFDPCYGIDSANNYQYSRTGFCTSHNITFRKAHQDEIEWLDECIKQNKTVPYEKSIMPKKSVNKWSAGTYVFIEKKASGILVPELSIYKITLFEDDCIYINGDCLCIDREEDGQIKWFATLEEAKAYKLKLIYTAPSVDPYETKQIDYDNSIDEQKQLNNIKDDKPIIDINKYQLDLSVKSALETNYKYFNNN